MTRTIALSDTAGFANFEQRIEDARLERHLHDLEVCEAAAEVSVEIRCPNCGHSQYDHAPDNLPPYRCTLLGCRCSRMPDHLIVEAPEEEAS